ncbi:MULTISPECIES: DUF924 family protein [Paracoccus]|jgi:uncharacterized protein (DUF924 family)|uniref:DUF924 domain-containing protein n=1 Tax=Paracoccus denitrificans (strain Pd 1222) TaxID=318586 RepID=A1AZN0_PARDP|nr:MULTISPECIES: DUF924 family protein [Paracoccus]ABL68724.1 protein of unknown function DUF924 [Paracoccus denitrificans PD1222]MBB4625550.1 uncharacterized protein (DUF924 family) [Paracoccus denitrificans]MCU7427281.1 DUF924 domain-containing protein [Paracoccus denitrificans]QAR26779.1 DUF924 domain-containing protein [Paracoccus denitrificans]UFS64114.1 DUF924 domain-containing protein [Paracoccus denitrificans]
MTDTVTPEGINRFWLDEVGEEGWYARSDDLDETIRQRFQPAWARAADLVPGWATTPEGALAGLILTDQFPRNMFREDARAFDTDPLARSLAREAIANGFHLRIEPPGRQFFYLPFEHSEDLADQERAVSLFAEFMPGENLRHAELHRDAIARFGRFPWRNAALNRVPTAAESRVMEAGGYGALVSGKLSLADV